MPKSKNNTAGFSKRLGKLIKSIRQKAVNNENLIKALNKVLHFNKPELFEFLGIKEFVSKLFQKTKTFIIPKNPDSFTISEETVMTFLKPVLEREAKLKNIIPGIDNDIWRWFLGKAVPGILKRFVVAVYRFIKTLTHQQILDEAESTKIKKVYTWFEALFIIRTVILAGEVNKKGKGCIVYFTFKVDDKEILYRFNADRNDDGQLVVDVGEVNLGNEWYAGRGACFSN
jgi:hypothetical protein